MADGARRREAGLYGVQQCRARAADRAAASERRRAGHHLGHRPRLPRTARRLGARAAGRRGRVVAAPTEAALLQDGVLEWYGRGGARDLPWRRTRDPYAILVS